MLTLDDFDYHLPEHLIAQNPPQERGQSRLLVVQSAQDGRAQGNKVQNHAIQREDIKDCGAQGDAIQGENLNNGKAQRDEIQNDKAHGAEIKDSNVNNEKSGAAKAASPLLSDLRFINLPQLLRPNDLLVFNNTKVIHARLFATKATGGRVEIMVERVLDERTVVAMLRASHTPKPGSMLQLADVAEVAVLNRNDMMFTLEFKSLRPDLPTALDIIEHCGQLPLPPYITHTPTAEDESRYQTVYAKEPGAVAAPTAGLHFTDSLLERLVEAGIGRAEITLHVGAGTFQPVKVQNISQHTMHRERYFIEPAAVAALERTRASGGRIIAVGTTSLRALESWAWNAQSVRGDTDIFITPGYEFKVVDALITNFHLPKSTLLMLVSALAGMDTIRAAYAHAVEREYRFFSYGDAMWLERAALPQ